MYLYLRQEGSKAEKKNHNNPVLEQTPCSIHRCHLPPLSVWCAFLLKAKPLPSRKRSSGTLWRAAFTAGSLTDVWARHADGCTHVNTHACIRALCQTGSVLSSATPRGKPAMTSPRGVQVQGRDRKWVTGSLSEADFAMPLTGCGRAGWGSVSYTSLLSWAGWGPQVVDLLFT